REQLREEHFYYAAHQVVYREIAAMLDGMDALDLMTLSQRLDDKKLLEEIGGAAYLSDLVTRVPTAANVEHYIAIVLEKSTRRNLIGFAHDLMTKCFDEGLALEEIQMAVSRKMNALTTDARGIIGIREAVKSAMIEIEQVLESDRHITGLTTG